MKIKLLSLLLLSGAVLAGACYLGYGKFSQKPMPLTETAGSARPPSNAYERRLEDQALEREEARAAFSDMRSKWLQDDKNDTQTKRR